MRTQSDKYISAEKENYLTADASADTRERIAELSAFALLTFPTDLKHEMGAGNGKLFVKIST